MNTVVRGLKLNSVGGFGVGSKHSSNVLSSQSMIAFVVSFSRPSSSQRNLRSACAVSTSTSQNAPETRKPRVKLTDHAKALKIRKNSRPSESKSSTSSSTSPSKPRRGSGPKTDEEDYKTLRAALDQLKELNGAAVVLKAGKARFFRDGSSMVFEDSVHALSRGSFECGELVFVLDYDGTILGWGLYSNRSMYQVRMMWNCSLDGIFELCSSENLEVHLEKLLRERLARAIQRRTSLALPNDSTNAFRAVNGEGDRISGLVVDILGTVAVVSSSALWLEVHRQKVRLAVEAVFSDVASKFIWRPSSARLVQDGLDSELIPALVWACSLLDKSGLTESTLQFVSKSHTTDFLLAQGKNAQVWKDQFHAALGDFNENELPAGDETGKEHWILENGLRYLSTPEDGQKTGFYCDQRENRAMIASISQNKDVLDCYSFTGGFGLNAARAKASSVLCVDSSESAIRQGIANRERNNLDSVEFAQQDVLKFLEQAINLGRSWDLVIVDPPKLAPNRQALHRALFMYKKINRLALKVVRTGGLLFTCSCSAAVTSTHGLLLKTINEVAVEIDCEVSVVKEVGPASDHGVNPAHLESNYLTGLLLSVHHREKY